MSEWSWEGTDYSKLRKVSFYMLRQFCFLDTISLTINTGNSTFPSLSHVNQSDSLDVVLADQSEHVDVDDLGWEHMRTALIAIVAGVIAFLTIVGNIMVAALYVIQLFCLTLG